jgi:hypothetical protein
MRSRTGYNRGQRRLKRALDFGAAFPAITRGCNLAAAAAGKQEL